MKILITAFEPFGGESINPALEAVSRLPERIGDAEIAALRLPVVFGECAEILREAVRREKPEAVVCVGQAGGRAGISIERVAVNVEDARIPDNAGDQPRDRTIVPGGPAAYFATLPIREMEKAAREAGIPAAVSNSAGTYVCNSVMYRLLHLLAEEYPGVRGGFVHVPYAHEQVMDKPGTLPSLSIAEIVRGLEACVGAVAPLKGQKNDG